MANREKQIVFTAQPLKRQIDHEVVLMIGAILKVIARDGLV